MTGIYKELLPKYNLVHDFVAKYQPYSLVDWGCANGNLLNRVEQDFSSVQELGGYDPGNPDYNVVPAGTYDCLVSCDVIEHFEPDQLDESLKLMQSKFSRAAFLIIACYPAKKHLPDGRNAHLIVENCAWWMSKIQQQFDQCHITGWQAVDYGGKPHKGISPKPELRLILQKNKVLL
jgi:hypothetical protein